MQKFHIYSFFPKTLERNCIDWRSIDWGQSFAATYSKSLCVRSITIYWSESWKSRKLKTLGPSVFFSARISVSARLQKKKYFCGHSHQMQKQAHPMYRLMTEKVTCQNQRVVDSFNISFIAIFQINPKSKLSLMIDSKAKNDIIFQIQSTSVFELLDECKSNSS